jgi:hypothetical protein
MSDTTSEKNVRWREAMLEERIRALELLVPPVRVAVLVVDYDKFLAAAGGRFKELARGLGVEDVGFVRTVTYPGVPGLPLGPLSEDQVRTLVDGLKLAQSPSARRP